MERGRRRTRVFGGARGKNPCMRLCRIPCCREAANCFKPGSGRNWLKNKEGGSSERARDSEQEQSRAGSPACSRQSLGTFQDMRACPSRRGDLVGGGGHPRQSQKSHKSLAVRHRGTHPSKPVSARERSYAPAPTCLTRPNPSGSKGHRLSFRHKTRPCVNQFVASATRRFFGRAWPLGHAQPVSP